MDTTTNAVLSLKKRDIRRDSYKISCNSYFWPACPKIALLAPHNFAKSPICQLKT